MARRAYRPPPRSAPKASWWDAPGRSCDDGTVISPRVWTAPTVAGLLVACAPAPARTAAPAPSSASAAATAPPPAPVARAAPSESRGGARGQGFHCQVQLEIRDADRASGTAKSDKSSDAAHDLAWRRACDALLTQTGLDCEDTTRVRVVKRSSSTSMTASSGQGSSHYEQTFELVGFRLAHGQGQADTRFADACADAAQHACEAALGTPCPDGRVTVLHAEGDDEDAPKRPRGRLTI